MNTEGARKAARQLHRDYRLSFPVNLTLLARELDIDVYHCAMPGKVNAFALWLRASGKFVAVVNRSQIPTRQRFTLAHEFGHILLGHHSERDLYASLTGALSDMDRRCEREADCFASELLLPTEVVKKLCLQDGMNAAAISSYFDVSRKAAEVKLRELSANPAFSCSQTGEYYRPSKG